MARILLVCALCMLGCHDYRVEAPPRADRAPADRAALDSASARRTDSCAGSHTAVSIDPSASIVRWRGTKFAGRGKHEGTVRLSSGHIDLCDGALVGGRFTVDMASIEVTDIPASDPVPRARLRTHLLSDDFFAAERFPTATFEIGRVEPISADSVRITGALTLRGVTEGIAFGARVTASADSVRADARFSIDRQRWGVAYRGSGPADELVDDAVSLGVTLRARQPRTGRGTP